MNNKHKMSLHKATLMLLLLATGIAGHAAEKEKADDARPLGCRDIGYQFKLKILHLQPAGTERQSLYFVFNTSSRPVSLYQMLKDNSTHSMHLNHVIHGRQWAALSTNEKELKYICTVEDAKLSYGKIVDCGDTLKVCEYARVKYGMNNPGNYWFVDSSRGGAVQQVLHYGIIPR